MINYYIIPFDLLIYINLSQRCNITPKKFVFWAVQMLISSSMFQKYQCQDKPYNQKGL
jgi:hypothetical protein